MFQLLVNDSTESQIAKLFCAAKEISCEIYEKDEICNIPEIEIESAQINFPMWKEHEGVFFDSLYPMLVYLNDRFPCPELMPNKLKGCLRWKHLINSAVYKLLHNKDEWKTFFDVEKAKILSPNNITMLDIVLIPILEKKEKLPKHLTDYVKAIQKKNIYKFSKGELPNDFTKRFEL